MYQYRDYILMVHSNSLITYYWKINKNDLRIIVIENMPFMLHTKIHKTPNHCACNRVIESIKCTIDNKSLSQLTICLN